MSNQFTYEIDERNLRIQLKELEVPLKEESWQKFEVFSDAQVSHHTSSPLRNFNLSLNRNVVLPVVFGVIIVLFSLLMVNFISIKNPKKEDTQKAEISPAMTQEPQIPAQEAVVVPKTLPAAQPEQKKPDTQTVAEVKTSSEQPAADTAAPGASQPQQAAPELAGTEVAVETTSTTDVQTETPVKKKRKRRSSDVDSELLPDIRPTLISEGEEENVRPN